jgi:hypothetical protein
VRVNSPTVGPSGIGSELAHVSTATLRHATSNHIAVPPGPPTPPSHRPKRPKPAGRPDGTWPSSWAAAQPDRSIEPALGSSGSAVRRPVPGKRATAEAVAIPPCSRAKSRLGVSVPRRRQPGQTAPEHDDISEGGDRVQPWAALSTSPREADGPSPRFLHISCRTAPVGISPSGAVLSETTDPSSRGQDLNL